MIPNFLQSLAATVRDLVRTGKAVHVTNATADELDLLAGLPWNKTRVDFACIDEDGTVSGANRKEWTKAITPSDLALGWLLASRVGANAEYFPGMGGEHAKRAAECAELAVIAAGDIAIDPNDGMWSRKSAHETGTREGARVAWGFIAEQCRPVSAGELTAAMQTMHDRYRRELEAM